MLALARVAAMTVLTAGAVHATGEPVETGLHQSFDVEVPYTPTIARVDGTGRLVYEVHATNFSAVTLTLVAVEVLDERTGRVVQRIDPATAARVIGASAGEARRLAPGQRAVVYLAVPWDDRGSARLVHRLIFDTADENGVVERAAIAGGPVAARSRHSAPLGAPLRGGPWAAIFLSDHNAGHRRYLYAVNGHVRIPGRHATDWMPAEGFDVRSAGDEVAPDGSGAEVLAVADGTIVAVKEERAAGAPEHVEDETGAMIVLRLDDGRHAFYEHLAPGLSVRTGQRVRRGQALARVGATGHVTRPHLHFHIADNASALDADGLPYVLAEGEILGRYATYDAFAAGESWVAESPRPVDGLPPANAVIHFGP